jgi:hypothetical protein
MLLCHWTRNCCRLKDKDNKETVEYNQKGESVTV